MIAYQKKFDNYTDYTLFRRISWGAFYAIKGIFADGWAVYFDRVNNPRQFETAGDCDLVCYVCFFLEMTTAALPMPHRAMAPMTIHQLEPCSESMPMGSSVGCAIASAIS